MNNNNDSAERLKDFNYFIDKLEIVYAILIAWGFAAIAKTFWSNQEYWRYLIICALVLMRFFFAASHNLKPIAKLTENRLPSQRLLFFWDVPILIAHSLIYYGMCKSTFKNSILNIPIPRFYMLFYCFLLPLNFIWLFSIRLRMNHFSKDPTFKIRAHFCWIVNNFSHIVIFVVLFILDFGKHLSLLFFFALTNCIIDLFITAPYYLGFVKSNIKVDNNEVIHE